MEKKYSITEKGKLVLETENIKKIICLLCIINALQIILLVTVLIKLL